MILNNIKSLLIHICVNIIVFFLYLKFNVFTGIADWASPEAYNAHLNKMILISVVIICFAQVLYFIGGRLLLKNQGNFIKNCLSTSVVAVLGIVGWLLVLPMTQLDAFSHSNLWQTYAIYVSYMLSLVENLEHYEREIPYLLLLSSILPTFVITAGIKREAKKKKVTFATYPN